MIVIIVHGIPPETSEDSLLKLKADLQCIVSGRVQIENSGFPVFFPSDFLLAPKKEIVILVHAEFSLINCFKDLDVGFYELAKVLAYRTKKFYFPKTIVHCFVQPGTKEGEHYCCDEKQN